MELEQIAFLSLLCENEARLSVALENQIFMFLLQGASINFIRIHKIGGFLTKRAKKNVAAHIVSAFA